MRRDFPEEGDIVIGTVKDVKPYGAFVELLEYPGKEGMI
ncbi:S1 RNA-binding domain-containing protein, partial [Methanocaldococcus sp.]